jgi:hypothetical protein
LCHFTPIEVFRSWAEPAVTELTTGRPGLAVIVAFADAPRLSPTGFRAFTVSVYVVPDTRPLKVYDRAPADRLTTALE